MGMRHWHPYIAETIERIVADGRRRLVAIALAPHYSAMSVGAYERKLADAAAGRLDVAMVRRWGDHAMFLDAAAAAQPAAQAAPLRHQRPAEHSLRLPPPLPPPRPLLPPRTQCRAP